MPKFESLDRQIRKTNDGRHEERKAIHQELAMITVKYKTAEMEDEFARAKIPHAPINTIYQVRQIESIAPKLTTTRTPAGKVVRLPPLAVDLEDGVTELSFAPSYSQHTSSILLDVGLLAEDITYLQARGIIP